MANQTATTLQPKLQEKLDNVLMDLLAARLLEDKLDWGPDGIRIPEELYRKAEQLVNYYLQTLRERTEKERR